MSLAAVAGKLAAVGTEAPDAGAAAAVSLAAFPVVTVVRLRLQPAIKQLHVVSAMISEILMRLEAFTVCSWSDGIDQQ
ncbi:hypothetical protein [Caballeronia novacaledonica]|uniref:Uncharacterized protein n=1 Tax=Caballeronia novacaledonica TaxID=1544861 RepID=A0AA37IFK4_9BURK|nr:hypothetical protein [Caballeronia novacaledonica]GJH28870.1 hypothetical protein CBA19CS42_30160 [Caballeronia novacaledonica]